jgi:hypothetical protein
LCAKGQDSICAKSLGRDEHKEISRFRIVTLRDVNSELKMLTYPCYGTGREIDGEPFVSLSNGVKEKLPKLQSPKGNGIDYWLEHCLWDVRHDKNSIQAHNELRVLKLAASQGVHILPEHAESIVLELRWWAFDAGRAFWVPDKAKKIINRDQLLTWWTQRLDAIASGGSVASGAKLREKMDEASLADDQIRMALELRRDYAQMVRTPRYMSNNDVSAMQLRVKSALASLRSRQMAGDLPGDGTAFHSLCLQKMDAINSELAASADDHSAFLKGCMYDIADRCLHRFTRESQ